MENFSLTTQVLQYVVTGMGIGSIYALVGLGLNIIYKATEVINFAQGEVVMLGGMIMIFCLAVLHLSIPLGFLLTVGIVTLVGVVFERLAIHPRYKAPPLTLIIITISASIVFQGLAMFIWGKDSFAMPRFSKSGALWFWGVTLDPQMLWVLGATLSVLTLLRIFFQKTTIGKAMMACSDDKEGATLVGINVAWMVMASFGISALLGAIAGIVITPISFMEWDRGTMFAVKGFSAAILGGLGTSLGVAIGGFLIGIVESLAAGLISSGFKDAVALLIMLLVLVFKPSGLFGSITIERLKK